MEGRPPGMGRGWGGKKGALAQHKAVIAGIGQCFHLFSPGHLKFITSKGSYSGDGGRKSIAWSKGTLLQGSGHREDRWE